MGMLSLADILLTDAQVSYKENRIIIYFKVNAEVNLAFKEHIQSLYNRFIKQETILVTIEEHSFESHIISLASAAFPEEYVSDDPVERLMCGDEFTLTVENDGSIPADAAEQGTAKAVQYLRIIEQERYPLTDEQIYKENRIIIYFKVNADKARFCGNTFL